MYYFQKSRGDKSSPRGGKAPQKPPPLLNEMKPCVSYYVCSGVCICVANAARADTHLTGKVGKSDRRVLKHTYKLSLRTILLFFLLTYIIYPLLTVHVTLPETETTTI